MDFNSGNYIKLFTDMMFEGFIVIDRNGKIQIYNEKAKEIFGIIPRDEISHRKGKIEKGDIVVLGGQYYRRRRWRIRSRFLKTFGN